MGTFNFHSYDPLSPLETALKSWYLHADIDDKRTSGETLTAVFDKLAHAGVHERPEAYFTDSSLLPARIFADVVSRFTKRAFEKTDSYQDSTTSFGYHTDFSVVYHDRYYPVTPHSHDFFEMVIVVRGHLKHHIGSDETEMQTGDIAIIPPQTVHALISDTDDALVFNMYIRAGSFERNFLSLLCANTLLGTFFRKTLASRTGAGSWLLLRTGTYFLGDNLLADICEEIQSENFYKQDAVNAMCRLFLIRLLESYSHQVFSPEMAAAALPGAEILSYIQAMDGNVSMKELAGQFGYSQRQIARLIHDYTGSTLTTLRHQLRMNRAAFLLTHSSLTVEEISALCGYQTPAHFYAGFKAQYHQTPIAYRSWNDNRMSG